MVGVFSWNDVDVFITLNSDLDPKLSLSQGHKDLHFSTSCHFKALYTPYIS